MAVGDSRAGHLSREPRRTSEAAPTRIPRRIFGAEQDGLLNLQRTAGNQAVTRLLRPSRVPASDLPPGAAEQSSLPATPSPSLGNQAFLRLLAGAAAPPEVIAHSHPDESAAHALASAVMRMAHPGGQRAAVAPPLDNTNAHVRELTPGPSLASTHGPGRPVEPPVREHMEQRFGHDFSRVRVHSEGEVADGARARGALAYTVGADVVFAPGQYQPWRVAGMRLLAHELAHVVQQSGGGSPPGQAQEHDAEAASREVSSGARPKVQAPSGIGFAAQPAPSVADEEYVPALGAPEHKPLPETKPEVLGRKDLDAILSGNARLRARVESVAKELDIDPGLLAAELFAEEGASAWSGTSGTVPSEVLGMDDWFGKDEKPIEESIIKAHPGLGLKSTDVKATGGTWDTSTEIPGGAEKPRGKLDADKAVAAFGVYFKMQEKVLRSAIRNKGTALRYSPIRTLEDLTPEQRFTVLRVGLNAGVSVGIELFLRLAQGGDIPRSGKTTRDKKHADRTAVLHVARAIHLAQAIFGRSPSDYKPREAPMSNKEAAAIFDHPEIEKLPDYIVPFNY